MRILVLIVFLCAYRYQLLAQEKTDAIQLEGVEVVGSHLKKGEVGVKSIAVDTLLLAQNASSSVSELLRDLGAGQIRSYGPSGLSSPSFRGTNGSQTSVLWNGIPLNSPLAGSSDVSQLPISVFDAVSIQKGGTSSLYGSGAIGGTIQLDNQFFFNQGKSLIFRSELGSFGHQFYEVAAKASDKKKAISVGIFHREVENDFSYTNVYQRPEITATRDNAAYQQSGIFHQLDTRLNENHIVGYKIWLQQNEYEVPNSILQAQDAVAEQNDEILRAMLHWNYAKGETSLIYKQAFLYHQLNFQDSSTQTNSTSTSTIWLHRLEGSWQLSNNWDLVSGLNHTYEFAGEENFGSVPKRNSTAFFGLLRYSSPLEKLFFTLNLRQELIDGELVPFTPSLGVEQQLHRLLKIRGSLSRNYRVSTFNDLFWQGGRGRGNPDLLPELSWGGEFGLDGILISNPTAKVDWSITTFSQSVDNWILWQPNTQGVWSPENVKKVWTRGIETSLNGSVIKSNWVFNFGLSYQLTRTTNEDVGSNFQRELNKQLIYTPQHETALNSTIHYRKFQFSFRHNYVGKQYTEGENKAVFSLDAYQVFDTTLSYEMKGKSHFSRVHFKINNLFNAAFENRRGFPMYGRNYAIGVQINFNKQNKNQPKQ